MIDDFINKIVTGVIETEDEFIFTTISPFCEEKFVRKISKSELVNALSQYFKPKTNFDKWIKENSKYVSINSKRTTICCYYAECTDCPLYLYYQEGNCTTSNPKVREWIESEVDE